MSNSNSNNNSNSAPYPTTVPYVDLSDLDQFRTGSLTSINSDYPVPSAPTTNMSQQSIEPPPAAPKQHSQRDAEIDDLQNQLEASLTVESVPENVQRFRKMRRASIDDINEDNLQLDSQVQLDWVKTLLEYIGDEQFLKNYNVNGEKLSKELSKQEMKKNELVFIKQAVKLLKRIVVENKDPEAQFLIGSLYSNSPIIKIGRPNILEKNYTKSFDYYHKAALQNHVLAIYRLAVSYELGIGTSVNESKALDCFIKSANLGCTPSMFKLGMIYSKGALKAQRSARYSMIWFERAAKLSSVDNPHALFQIARIYEGHYSPFFEQQANSTTPTTESAAPSQSDLNYLQELRSLGYQPDDATALHYYKEAAKYKYPPAQHKLGSCYEYGILTCGIDAKKSIGWYSRSATQGYPPAELALSGWYLTGASGILEPSDREAFLWASKAASSGFAKAEYALGYYYEVGLGCSMDVEMSRKYYIRAATRGHEKAIQRLKTMQK